MLEMQLLFAAGMLVTKVRMPQLVKAPIANVMRVPWQLGSW